MDRLAELAVAAMSIPASPGADDVDHRLAQTRSYSPGRTAAVTAALEDAPELRRAHEAPHVRRQDAIGVVHASSVGRAGGRIGELRNLRGWRSSSCCLRA